MATKVSRVLAGVAAAAVAPAVLLVTAATPAAAAPSGCQSEVNLAHSAAVSYCAGGSGTHQAVAFCTGGDMVFGPRVSASKESWALCDRWNKPPNEWWVTDHAVWVYN